MSSRRCLPTLVPAAWVVSAFVAIAQLAPPAPPTLDLAKWEPEIRAFEQADRTSPPAPGGILFTGSSSIRLWTTLQDDFRGLPVLNRGFGGSQIREVTGFADRIVIPYRPRLIVFYCGSNDIVAGRAVPDVVEDLRGFVATVHAKLPKSRVIFIANAPNPARWHLKDAWIDLNARIKAYTGTDPRLTFVDIWPAMLDASGQPRPELFVEDRLHMSAQGYAIWTRVLRPVVEREFKSAGTEVPAPH